MNVVFPKVRSGPITDVPPGTLIRFQRSSGSLLAIVTDQISGDSRSLVILNKPTERGPITTFIENWRNPESVLSFVDEPRFEINTNLEKCDPTGRKSWETAGVLVAIADRIFVRAYHESVFGDYKLIDIQTGSILSGLQYQDLYSFLTWQIWIRDPMACLLYTSPSPRDS